MTDNISEHHVAGEAELQSRIAALESALSAKEERLAAIDRAAKADADDLAQMRDGTKLTRAGLVEVIVYQQQEIAAKEEELRGCERDKWIWRKADEVNAVFRAWMTNDASSLDVTALMRHHWPTIYAALTAAQQKETDRDSAG